MLGYLFYLYSSAFGMKRDITTDRQNLVTEHLALAKSLALSVARSLSLRPDLYEELFSLANQGLSEAAVRYDPSRGTAFSTYAYYRIRGTIYDGLRNMGILDRRQRNRVLSDQRSDEVMEQTLTNRREAASVTGSLESAIEQMGEMVANLIPVQLVCMDVEELSDRNETGDPSKKAEETELQAILHKTMDKLPELERKTLELTYFKEMSLKEAGDVMGLSRSWVCRIHCRAIRLLRAAMAKAAP